MNIKIVKGSSKLLATGILPVGKSERVPRIKDRWTKEEFVKLANDLADLAEQFYEKFAEERVKTGCLKDVKRFLETLYGIKPRTRAKVKQKPSASPKKRVSKEMKEKVTAEVDYKPEGVTFGYSENPTFVQLVGVSGTGKGTRVAQLLLYFLARSEAKFVGYVLDDKTDMLGFYIKPINLFIVGKFVKSNKSGLLSLTGADAFNSVGMFDHMCALMRMFGAAKINFLIEGYVAMFSDKFGVASAIRAGYTRVFKRYFQYNSKEELIERVIERSGKPCKGDSSWAQNHYSANMYSSDLEEARKLGVLEECSLEMRDFKEDHKLFGAQLLRFLDYNVNGFLQWSKENSALRVYTDKDSNYRIYGKHFERQILFRKALKEGKVPKSAIINLGSVLKTFKKGG